MTRAIFAPLAFVIGLPFAGSLVACGTARGADSPMSAEALGIKVVGAPDPECKKVGTVRGIGRDLDESAARRQALEGAQEEAAKMGAEEMVVKDETRDLQAASGGTAYEIAKIADVFDCEKAKP